MLDKDHPSSSALIQTLYSCLCNELGACDCHVTRKYLQQVMQIVDERAAKVKKMRATSPTATEPYLQAKVLRQLAAQRLTKFVS